FCSKNTFYYNLTGENTFNVIIQKYYYKMRISSFIESPGSCVKMYGEPRLIDFPRIGKTLEGYISVAENDALPFEVKRVYWTYFTPESIKRGGHAHHHLEQILVAVAGKIIVTTQMPGEDEQRTILETADQGIFLPKYCWHRMQYSHNAVQMCIANMAYEESDYIRDYEEFKKLIPVTQ
ncbi:MAG TPA: FdtA/QdtA family cupin domain-containing protein, partial [Hanamia sp.]|nr:FdtA/QdtA family cupin domain-containing protein [Hanamia sp.]